jgi:hypothetical protein
VQTLQLVTYCHTTMVLVKCWWPNPLLGVLSLLVVLCLTTAGLVYLRLQTLLSGQKCQRLLIL